MNKPYFYIGGEFWFQSYLQDEDIDNDINGRSNLLSGGENAIEFILSCVNINKDEIILLPSYLCPKIINLVDKMKIKYKFYKINRYLTIDTNDIFTLINKYNVRAFFFINYFGFYHKEYIIKFIKGLKNDGIIVIEDAVQMFWIHKQKKFIGDYIFNSYRKFLPIDGSIVLCNETVNIESVNDRYFYSMEEARNKKTKFIIEGVGLEEEFLLAYNRANIEYYNRNRIYGINKKHKDFLNIVPVQMLLDIRRKNYEYLFNGIKKLSNVEVVYDIAEVGENIPLMLPIFVNNRDYIRCELMKHNIFAPIHWDLRNEPWIDKYKEAINISSRILSLPIDWRYDIDSMDYLLEVLKGVLDSTK